MKRFRVGAALLLILLVLSMAVQSAMDAAHIPTAQELSRAGELAAEGDWENAAAAADRAQIRWKRFWRLTAALCDHQPMEDVDSLMAQLPVQLAAEDGPAFAALCAELSRRVEAMADAHRLSWENLL